MFIELTDHLRCPAPHDEQYLVLVPQVVERRSVRSGHLGCPVCHREFPIQDGVAVFGSAGDPVAPAPDLAGLTVEGLHAFLGLRGPGGYVALVGTVAALGPAVVELMRGVHFIGVNTPAGVVETPMLSLLRAPALPVKRRSLRAVAVGGDYAGRDEWLREAVRALLPGLHLVAQGEPDAAPDNLEVLASAGGWWVGRKTKD